MAMAQSWKNRHVLVTGGTGFIGSFFVEALLDKGATVCVPLRAENYRALSSRRAEIEWIEGDLRDSAYCEKLIHGVDHIFHLAGSRRNTEFHKKRPSDVMNDNIRMSLALLDAIKEQEISVPVTFFSTANVPESMDTIAIARSDTLDGYVLGKAISEALWIAASRQRSFPLLVVRAIGAYGPRDTFKEDGNLIPALMVQARDAKDELTVWGDGTQERAFLYVEDLVKAVFTLLDAEVDGIQYITSNDVVTAKELAEHIRDIIRPDLPVTVNPEKHVEQRAIPKLPTHDLLKNMEWTSLQDGLQKTYKAWNGI